MPKSEPMLNDTHGRKEKAKHGTGVGQEIGIITHRCKAMKTQHIGVVPTQAGVAQSTVTEWKAENRSHTPNPRKGVFLLAQTFKKFQHFCVGGWARYLYAERLCSISSAGPLTTLRGM